MRRNCLYLGYLTHNIYESKGISYYHGNFLLRSSG